MMSEDIIESVFYIDRGYVDKVTLATRLTKDNVSLSAIEYNNDDGSSFAKTMDPHIYILTISGLCVAVFLRRAYSRLVRLQNPEIYTLHATANNPQAYIRDARGLKGADMQIILFKKGAVGTDAGRLKQIHTDTVGINRNTAQPSAGRSETDNLKAVDTTEYSAIPAANGSDNAMPSGNVAAPTSQSGRSRRKRENRRSRKISLSKLAVGTSNQGREVTVF
ncbi:hypothetical protein GGI23_004572 [Coemansia sp. RSA 2559]|nr:hypothetical protein GGI23_004572 [Coemansia sp. RSA 2559]